MAPLTRRRKAASVAAAAPVIDAADRLSSLPESILAEILSFLPAQQAVRTCVLARAWRHVWKFTTHLLITGDSVQEVREFVDRLLRARLAALVDGLSGGGGGGPLDVCVIRFDWFKDEDMRIVNRWIRLAVACRVQGLDIEKVGNNYFRISNRTLVSQHLTSLKLSGVWFSCEYLDFSGCPALEHLEIHDSSMIYLRKMTSQSVKNLVITYIMCSQNYRFRIYFPRLVSLRLENIIDRYPVLESMPELEVAYVIIKGSYWDTCRCNDRMGCEHVMGDDHSLASDVESDTEEESDDCGGQNTTKCVLLEGLSQARDLELRACERTYIFRRDLRCCPTFFKLKTLLLDDHWCEPGDCHELVCILEHAPVLEELNVIFWQQLGWSKYNVEFEGYLNATVESNMMPRCLKIVKVKCRKVDEKVLSVLNYLQTLNIRFHSRIAKG